MRRIGRAIGRARWVPALEPAGRVDQPRDPGGKQHARHRGQQGERHREPGPRRGAVQPTDERQPCQEHGEQEAR